MTVVVDYGMGNVASILNMLAKLGASAEVSSDPRRIAAAARLILPGVGAFDDGMRGLEERDLIAPLTRKVAEGGAPILGICLGMQLLTRGSEEGRRPGLGWVPAFTCRLPRAANLKQPHMGWSEVHVRNGSTLFAGFDAPPRFYFVHSYHVACDDPSLVAATALHGAEFTAAVERNNITGTQFHPEKSHRFGLQLLRNFVTRP